MDISGRDGFRGGRNGGRGGDRGGDRGGRNGGRGGRGGGDRGGRNGGRGGERGNEGDYGGRGGRIGGSDGRGRRGGAGNYHQDQQQQHGHVGQQPWGVQGQTGTHAPPVEGGSAWQNSGSVWNQFRGGHSGRAGGSRGGSDLGRGQTDYAQAPTPSVAPSHAHDSVITEMRSMEISKPLAAPSSFDDKNKAVPVRRPDNGGVLCVRRVKLLANHFKVEFNPDSTIWHYTVNVKAVPNKNGFTPKITKSDLILIRNKLASDRPEDFPLSMTAYDGDKSIFSAVQLPLPAEEIKVDISKGDDGKISSYTITVSLFTQLKLHKLKDYLSGKLFSIPRDVLQAIDVIMKENPTRRLIRVGGSFFPSEFNPKDDLGYGVAASRGFQHSIKPTSQLALCLDSSTLAFRKRLPVIEYLEEQIRGFSITDFEKYKRKVLDVLRGLKVTVTHRITKQKYTIAGLTKSVTGDLSFTEEDPEGKLPPKIVFVVDYFLQKYGKEILHKNIPCLDLGKNNEANHVPMEFCVLVEGQRFPKEDLDRSAAILLKEISMPKPKDRQNRICGMVQSGNGPCGGGICEKFGFNVDPNMTQVDGRVIGPPELRMGTQNGGVTTMKVVGDKCQWNLLHRSLVSGTRIDRWAVIDFSSKEDRCWLDADMFIPSLIGKLCSLGAPMKEPLVYQGTSMNMFNDVGKLQQLLESVIKSAARVDGGRLQFILCVMARTDPGYKSLKYICETQLGVVTQCCLSDRANKGLSDKANKGNDQYFSNLALKINAKLGGSNVELKNRLPLFEGDEDHVMFIGADVNHPGSKNIGSPSIAAVVASVNWPAANRYAAQVRAQTRRKERIVDFGEMCLELLEAYVKNNKVRPKNIVVFRDGVSDGQFDMVLNEELVDMKRAFHSMGYFPTITVVVAQKRHLTRLFPMTEKDGSVGGNISPGTVVDTGIEHPSELGFYLCSHYGAIGTSKPTHYHVLLNEHKFSSDQLQTLIYNLCFTFARCTKPVSLVPPVYYADIAAYRGRMYHEALEEGCSKGDPSENMFKLHGNLENDMFFI